MLNITNDGFIVIEIDDDMVARARAKDEEMGVLNNSIRQGAGNIVGFLGEEVLLKAWAGSTSQNSYNHDVEFEGVTFEVKTKDRTVPPRLSYEASIAKFNDRQTADYYVFVSLYRAPTGEYVRGYVLGVISKRDYRTMCKDWKVGDIDPSNGWKVKAACHNLGHEHLNRFEGWAA